MSKSNEHQKSALISSAVQQIASVGGSALAEALMTAVGNSQAESGETKISHNRVAHLQEINKLLAQFTAPLPKDLASEVKIPILLERNKSFLKVLTTYYRLLCLNMGAGTDESISHLERIVKIFEEENNAIFLAMGNDAPFEGERRAEKPPSEFSSTESPTAKK